MYQFSLRKDISCLLQIAVLLVSVLCLVTFTFAKYYMALILVCDFVDLY